MIFRKLKKQRKVKSLVKINGSYSFEFGNEYCLIDTAYLLCKLYQLRSIVSIDKNKQEK